MTEEIIVRQEGRLGHLILNRPRALNALTRQMVGEIKDRLEAWKDDDSVQTVLVSGAGERGLCAGAMSSRCAPRLWKAARRRLTSSSARSTP